MKILEYISLAPYTTFKIGGIARFFCEVTTVGELKEALSLSKKFFILGGGSNILMGDFDGVVIKMNILGKGNMVGAGENWDEYVAWTLSQNLYGLENLSYIPGTVGAAPVQNIGAYGVEAKDRITEVHTINAETLEEKIFSNRDCNFAYRNSIFKKEKKWIITHVVFNFTHSLNTSYKGLENLTTPKEIRDAVVSIRKEKLPDWNVLGTAGSFFKNPIIAKGSLQYPDMPIYPIDEKTEKVSLAWIIDKVCGLKGYKKGNVGLYQNQALVIVNFGSATKKEVDDFADEIARKVKEKTGLDIEREVESV